MPDAQTQQFTAEFMYDRDCGFCMKSSALLERIDRRDRVKKVALQEPGAPEHFGVTLDQALDRAWALDSSGRSWGGAAAINVALGAVLGTRIPLYIYRIPGIRWLQDGVYGWIAANRYRLPGKGGSCAVDEHRQ
jgi:predicted DCC family thiol-disulfide oxidoreductase YuxK